MEDGIVNGRFIPRQVVTISRDGRILKQNGIIDRKSTEADG